MSANQEIERIELELLEANSALAAVATAVEDAARRLQFTPTFTRADRDEIKRQVRQGRKALDRGVSDSLLVLRDLQTAVFRLGESAAPPPHQSYVRELRKR